VRIFPRDFHSGRSYQEYRQSGAQTSRYVLPGSHTIPIEKKPDGFLEEGAKHLTQEEDGALADYRIRAEGRHYLVTLVYSVVYEMIQKRHRVRWEFSDSIYLGYLAVPR
jgi:hypothetical protein